MRIVYVDDFPILRQGLMAILKPEEGFEIVGEANSIKDAMEVITKLSPDLVILDLWFKGESGLDILKEIKKLDSYCKCLIMTLSHKPEDFMRANDLGIDGYIFKDAMPEEIINAIRSVARGRKYYDPSIIEWVLTKQNQHAVLLTTREQEVLSALGAGLSNKDISERLHITEYTVKKHVSQVLVKLGLSCRTQAALFAKSQELGG